MIFVEIRAILMAAVVALAWLPPAEAGTSFSFSFHGGDGYRHGYFHDRYYGRHGGYYRDYRHRRHYYVFPGHGVRHGHAPPFWWQHRRDLRRHYEWRGPRCIYRYGYRYCR